MNNSKKLSDTSAWLLLVVSLPTQSATARMRIWRALKARGCMALRDGALEVPTGPQGELWIYYSGLPSMPTILGL